MASRTAYSTWTPQKPTLFSGHYLRNRSNLDIGVLGYIGIVQHKEHSPEVSHIPPGTPCITRPGDDAACSPLQVLRFMIEWSYNFPPSIYLLGVDRNSFTFHLVVKSNLP